MCFASVPRPCETPVCQSQGRDRPRPLSPGMSPWQAGWHVTCHEPLGPRTGILPRLRIDVSASTSPTSCRDDDGAATAGLVHRPDIVRGESGLHTRVLDEVEDRELTILATCDARRRMNNTASITVSVSPMRCQNPTHQAVGPGSPPACA